MTHPLSSDIEHWHLTCSHFVVLCNTFLILPTHPTPWKLVTQEKPEKYPTIYSVILPVLGVFINGVEMVSKSPNVLWLKYIYELLRISWFKIWSRFTEDNVESQSPWFVGGTLPSSVGHRFASSCENSKCHSNET